MQPKSSRSLGILSPVLCLSLGFLACNGKTPTEPLVATRTPTTLPSSTPTRPPSPTSKPRTPTASPTATPTAVPGLRLTGTLYDWEGGTVRDTGTVTIEGGPQNAMHAHTDSLGRYVLTGLSPGTIQVLASATNFTPQKKKIAIARDTTLDFTLLSP